MTSLTGMKLKVAHKRANSETWSATPSARRKRMIAFLKDVIVELERQQPAKKPRATPKRQKKVVAGQMARRRTIERSA
jgi:hypothetical protein